MRFHRQPDGISCGASCLVTARMLLEPDAAEALRDPSAFTAAVARAHRGLTGIRGATGALRLPWPRHLGTPPWSLSEAMSELTGMRYRIQQVRSNRARVPSLLSAAPVPIPLYLGNAWLPRHVLLVLPGGGAVYDPAIGDVLQVSAERWRSEPLRIAGWDVPWAILSPSSGPDTRA